MDIFSSSKRGKEDSIKKPLNYPESSVTEKRLQQDNKRQIQQFKTYLRNLYVKLDFKINSCKYNCIGKAKSYQQVGECEQKCGQGVGRLAGYVDSRVGEMQQLLGDCVSNASTLNNAMDQIYYCYQIYNMGFRKLKQFITEESMFYE